MAMQGIIWNADPVYECFFKSKKGGRGCWNYTLQILQNVCFNFLPWMTVHIIQVMSKQVMIRNKDPVRP